jgi:butyrate kinase
MERLLILNPGSTSTKIAVYDDETPVFTKSIDHSTEELKKYATIVDQFEFREELIVKTLKEENMPLESITAIVSRGGLLPPVEAGAYTINEDMVWQLRNKPHHEHASNLGAIIAYSLIQKHPVPAFVYDGVTVDEMLPILRITGLPSLPRRGIGHNLNMRAAGMRYAKEHGKEFSDCSLIVVHLGGGISVCVLRDGKIIDIINDGEGPFSPERTGALPMHEVIETAFSGKYTEKSMMKLIKTQGGLVAHLGTVDVREVEKMIRGGDEHAKLILEAMALNVAKNIGKETPVVSGDVEAIILTGGIAYSKYFTGLVEKYVSFIAPVIVYPGENEMESLALGGLRVLRGEESAKTFKRVE